ncbi:MAG: phenylalanine--tRNA ligase subunit beta, partial [Rickettsiales bacterium]|nr:phenylalanine--tRNA ligase subunit beta [Rickettsiales bacterium]
MKFTYDWLKDYLVTSKSPQEIADILTHIGLEVEDLTIPLLPIAAKIVECVAHPDSDHLRVLRVDDGFGTLRQVVCGAPNARAGLVSALAMPGCKIGDMEIKSGKIRGVLSDGMMCSGKEMGINNDHDGIIELDPASETLGSVVSILCDTPDAVFDAGITPNRPDYLAVRGIAMDLAAAGVGTFTDEIVPSLAQVNGTRQVIIENKTACPTYRL